MRGSSRNDLAIRSSEPAFIASPSGTPLHSIPGEGVPKSGLCQIHIHHKGIAKAEPFGLVAGIRSPDSHLPTVENLAEAYSEFRTTPYRISGKFGTSSALSKWTASLRRAYYTPGPHSSICIAETAPNLSSRKSGPAMP